MMQLNGEKVVAAVGVNGDVLALTDEGRVYVRQWSESSHEYVWKEQPHVPLRTSAQMGQPVQSVAGDAGPLGGLRGIPERHPHTQHKEGTMYSGGISSSPMIGQSLRSMGEGAMAAPPSTAMGDVTARVERLCAKTSDLIQTLDVIGDRVLGSEPQNVMVENDKQGYVGTLGVVFTHLDELERLLNVCTSKASRLTQL